MTDKTQKATEVKCKHGHTCDKSTQNSQYSWNLYSSVKRASELQVLELVRSRTQNFTIIDQEKHKIKQIYIILETHNYQT